MTSNKKKTLIVAGLIGLGVLALAFSAKAATPDILITDHDNVYDYKLSNGRWFTRSKGSEAWVDMQTALSPENYQLAISRLTTHLKK